MKPLYGVALLTLSLAVAPMAAAPQKGSVGKQAAETGFNVVIVPPDGLYEVTIRPDTPAPKGERAYWSIYPRKSVKTVKRNELEWKMRVPKGPYEASYTTYVNNEQVDSFVEFTVGGGPAPGPGPTPPPVPPDPEPDPTKLGAAWIIVVEQSENRTPTQAAVIGNGPMWQTMKTKGHGWRVLDYDNAFVKKSKYDLAADRVGMPALLIVSKAGTLLHTEKMPETSAALEQTVTRITGL